MPSRAATAATPAQMAATTVCRVRGNAGSNNPSEMGTISAAPTAWVRRPAISTPGLGATAHSTEADVKDHNAASGNPGPAHALGWQQDPGQARPVVIMIL